LYLDDLDALVRLLRSRSREVVVGAGRATADDVMDLQSATPPELAEITVETKNPDVVIRLYRKQASVSTSEDTEDARALVNDAGSILKDHAHAVARSLILHIVVTLVVAIFWLSSIAGSMAKASDPLSVILLSILLGLVLAFVIFISYAMWQDRVKTGRARVIPMNRSEARQTRSSNGAPLWAALVGAVAGSAVTLVGQSLLGQ